MDFSGLIVSLHASALTYLGAMETPEGGFVRDMDLARQSVDMLRVIEEKSRGNLTADERTLIDKLLYDIQIAYVKATEDATADVG
jgi:hypothetical protein